MMVSYIPLPQSNNIWVCLTYLPTCGVKGKKYKGPLILASPITAGGLGISILFWGHPCFLMPGNAHTGVFLRLFYCVLDTAALKNVVVAKHRCEHPRQILRSY